MFAFPHMVDFLAHEFAGLGARGFALRFVFSSSINGFLLWHVQTCS